MASDLGLQCLPMALLLYRLPMALLLYRFLGKKGFSGYCIITIQRSVNFFFIFEFEYDTNCAITEGLIRFKVTD